ncbi:unnamed protein product [Oppiella nova]|uniref:BHLH domain-containing protein n=1 Tax=Oppiella nova TaxID=334625 RepID=A0A7R9QVI2_9ACAR|nr:unnamed protein product [Oppiella nova]CAG2175907.1 unnamed protein product [Oppiella nova]
MSLDTLLEAAEYLDHIQSTDSSDDQRRDYMASDSVDEGDVCVANTYHLKVDPNVPISVQFHTYTSCAAAVEPMSGMVSNTSITSNNSTKLNAHQNVGHLLMNEMNIGSTIRSSMNANNFVVNSNGVNISHKNRDHSSYSRHREMHKTLEKNRRAHLRHCFEVLKDELPVNEYNEKKSSHINIISCAIRYIQHLKRTESELHHQTQRLVRTKMRFQNQIAQLRDDLKEAVIDGTASIGRPDRAHSLSNLYDNSHDNCLQFEQSDEEVIIDLETGEECYDDETTTTASGLSLVRG